MVDPLIFFNDALKSKAQGGFFFYFSIALFCFQFLLGALYLLWLSSFANLKKKRVNWLGGFYKFCFLLDLFLCITHASYAKDFSVEIASVYLVCLLKYMALIALYGLVLAHRKVLILREIDAVNAKRAQQRERLLSSGNIASINCTAQNSLSANSLLKKGADNKVVDVNIAYLRSVIDCLKNKNLTDEERERITQLEFSLKAPLREDGLSSKKLNGECEYLIKKMTEYGVSV
ncbi:MAG: hypothetical protein E7339_07110 [Clostridiales bacterium]|nr:hypothetical protein [Clostridiales bacterium]